MWTCSNHQSKLRCCFCQTMDIRETRKWKILWLFLWKSSFHANCSPISPARREDDNQLSCSKASPTLKISNKKVCKGITVIICSICWGREKLIVQMTHFCAITQDKISLSRNAQVVLFLCVLVGRPGKQKAIHYYIFPLLNSRSPFCQYRPSSQN